jgi:uncharacterized protein YjbI with pentapeptide repeats
MANSRHLARLRADVQKWNSWRHKNSDVSPDLSGADLSLDLQGANLRKADLAEAVLYAADLKQADLSFSSLRRADLSLACLTQAKLFKADLSEANARETDLSNCRLSKAVLRKVNFASACFTGTNLFGADLSRASLPYADLRRTDINLANFTHADLRGADFKGTKLMGVNFSKADLRGADFRHAYLFKAKLTGADLAGANLTEATLIRTNLTRANLTGCHVYGVSPWDLRLEGAIQSDLIITPERQSTITVDNLEVAQFVYALLKNRKIRQIIDSITSKLVLILGRFKPERKAILYAIRDELRKRNYTPVLFDFDRPSSRDITETVSTLAHMARFVIADITDAKSIPQELMAIVPNLPSVPVQPLLLASQREYGMFEHFKRFPWVLEPYLYEDQDRLLAALTEKVIGPAEAKAKEQTGTAKL